MIDYKAANAALEDKHGEKVHITATSHFLNAQLGLLKTTDTASYALRELL
jgi:hypothetical protein